MKKIATILSLTLILATSSCSTIQKILPFKSKVHKVETKTVKIDKKGNAEVVIAPEANAPETGNKPPKDKLCENLWAIISVAEINVEGEDDAPYVAFDENGRFYAYDGCNNINGDYLIKSDGEIVFSNHIATSNYCTDVEYAPAIAKLFEEGLRLSIDFKQIGRETYLYFKNSKGNVVATLRRHNMEFLNGYWAITWADGISINDEEANLFIDVNELKIHGNTGCNYFNGQIYIDPAKANSIDFSNMQIAQTHCAKENQERAIMVALEQCATAIPDRDSNVMLTDKEGRQLMTLRRIK